MAGAQHARAAASGHQQTRFVRHLVLQGPGMAAVLGFCYSRSGRGAEGRCGALVGHRCAGGGWWGIDVQAAHTSEADPLSEIKDGCCDCCLQAVVLGGHGCAADCNGGVAPYGRGVNMQVISYACQACAAAPVNVVVPTKCPSPLCREGRPCWTCKCHPARRTPHAPWPLHVSGDSGAAPGRHRDLRERQDGLSWRIHWQ